jgi:hypothetical protein
VHGQILAQLLVAADHIDQHADLGTAVDVGRQLALGLDAHEAADAHVLADLADQRGAGRFDRALAHRQPTAQRRRPGSCPATSRAQSAASLRNSSFLATKSVSQLISKMRPACRRRRSVDCHDALGGNAGRRLAGLVAQLDAQDFLGLAMSPPASVSAFLHSIIGASVFSRSSLTMLAVISAISSLQNQSAGDTGNRYTHVQALTEPIAQQVPAQPVATAFTRRRRFFDELVVPATAAPSP